MVADLMTPLPLGEREGPAAKRWEGEGTLLTSRLPKKLPSPSQAFGLGPSSAVALPGRSCPRHDLLNAGGIQHPEAQPHSPAGRG